MAARGQSSKAAGAVSPLPEPFSLYRGHLRACRAHGLCLLGAQTSRALGENSEAITAAFKSSGPMHFQSQDGVVRAGGMAQQLKARLTTGTTEESGVHECLGNVRAQCLWERSLPGSALPDSCEPRVCWASRSSPGAPCALSLASLQTPTSLILSFTCEGSIGCVYALEEVWQ